MVDAILRMTVLAVLALAAVNAVQTAALLLRLVRHIASRHPEHGLRLWLPIFSSIRDARDWLEAWRRVLRRPPRRRAPGDQSPPVPRAAFSDLGHGDQRDRPPPGLAGRRPARERRGAGPDVHVVAPPRVLHSVDTTARSGSFRSIAYSAAIISFTVTRRCLAPSSPLPAPSGPRPTEWMRGSSAPCSTRYRRTDSTRRWLSVTL
jgi:hypothetical protein